MVNINNEIELGNLVARIHLLLQQGDLDQVLFGLRQNADKCEPFMLAGSAMFAVRFSMPPILLGGFVRPTSDKKLAEIVGLVTHYLLADPVSFDSLVESSFHGSTLIPVILRCLGSQAPYATELFGQYARTEIMFKEIPQYLALPPGEKRLDLDQQFQKITGASLIDFVNIGFALYAAALSNSGFTGGWFQKARDQGLAIPDDELVCKILDEFAADPWEFRDLYESGKQPDRRFAAYDYNPLLDKPLIRMRSRKSMDSLDDEYYVAPLPNLILRRISNGVYYRLRSKDFTGFFGHVFAEYIGIIFRNSFDKGVIISECDIRKTYPESSGKVPDWIIIEGDTAILVECKATRFTGKALRTADSTELDLNLRQLLKGLKQLNEFKKACEQNAPGLGFLHGVSKFLPIVVTFDDLFTINSQPFRKIIDGILAQDNVQITDWQVFSIGQMETLQPHLQAGLRFSDILEKSQGKVDGKELNQVTGRSYKDSFLYQKEKELYKRLNVPFA